MKKALLYTLAFVLAGCAQLAPRPELPESVASGISADSPLDQIIGAFEDAHPGESAFRLVADGTEAFAARVQSGRQAARSLDVQTYIWHEDLTGVYLAQLLLQSADRGVRVRLLVDDMDARAKNDALSALAAHPGIEVRVFNPFASRSGTLRMVSEGVRSFSRINRRMHNKTWIADNRLAIVGGRNIGDEYFAASDEVNFVDLDVAMIGPVVREISLSFDRYWNSPSAYPLEVLDSGAVSADALEKLRQLFEEQADKARVSRYAQALRSDETLQRYIAGDWPMRWSGSYRFVADDPLKISMTERNAERAAVGAALVPLVRGARTEVRIISPYFVPGAEVTADLVAAAKSGRKVSVLTNSLAANDVAAVHGGYSRFRKALLEGGVQIWELKPLEGTTTGSSLFGSSGASLHTKAISVDRQTLFVGSFNLDPRSTWLNCEQGVLADDAVLTEQLDALFDAQAAAAREWKVTLEEGELRWTDDQGVYDSEPRASLGRRMQAWLARTLRIDAQL